MAKKTVQDIDVRGKRVLLRADFNVPFRPNSLVIADSSRIRVTIPTIRYLQEHGACVILCSHLGRPKGQVKEELRLTPVAKQLSRLLGQEVPLASDCIGPAVREAVQSLGEGDVLLLENLRFYPGEEKNDPTFAKELASLADIYVNDAFGTAHRAHASTEGVAHYLPAVAGLLMNKEVESLTRALAAPAHPFSAVFGGSKVTDKMGVLENLIGKVDHLLIGGGMATAFLRAYDHPTGASSLEEDDVSKAREVLRAAARAGGIEILLPIDVVVASEISDKATPEVVFSDSIPEDKILLDIGPRTIEMFKAAILESKTVVWNGPMGVFEYKPFAEGTFAVARILAEATEKGAFTVTGGGSTAEAVDALGLADNLSLVSTGGGATLEFLEGKELPGIAALEER